MKRISFWIILISLMILLLSNDDRIEFSLNAKEIYQKGFKDLKPLPKPLINEILNHFDDVSHWNSYQYMCFSYPLDTVNKETVYQMKRTNFIARQIEKLSFYYFPMNYNGKLLPCFLVTCTDSNAIVRRYKSLEVYFFDATRNHVPPIRLLSYTDFYDGLSTYCEDSHCKFGKENSITSIFISERVALDLTDYSDSIPKPDSIIIKMKLKGDSTIEVISEYNSL
jgi:hypothetical protein